MIAPKFAHKCRCTLLWRLPGSSTVHLRGYHPLWRNVPVNFGSSGSDLREVQQHHISNMFPYRIQFALYRVRSLLLTASQLVSLPAGTKMFQFPAFPILSDSMVKSHSGIFGSKVTCTSPKLTVACHSLRRGREPSHPPDSLDVSHLCMASLI